MIELGKSNGEIEVGFSMKIIWANFSLFPLILP